MTTSKTDEPAGPDAWVRLDERLRRLVARDAPGVLDAPDGAPPEAAPSWAPLWVSVLAQAWQGAVALPDFDFARAVAVVAASQERKDAVAMSGRLGTVHASDVLAMVQEWEQGNE
jgi:hypothetical protein